MKQREGWIGIALALTGVLFGSGCQATRTDAEQWRIDAMKATERGDWVGAGDLSTVCRVRDRFRMGSGVPGVSTEHTVPKGWLGQ